jgi:hypothetical protein
MTGLTPPESAVLDTIRAHGTLAVDTTGSFASTIRALAARGLVTYDRAEGLVTHKTEEN